MHIDMNSCFCSVEQEANHLLRGKPIAVCAYISPSACIISPSIEAKKMGVETGMRIREGLALCPQLQCMMPDPAKYKYVNRKFLQIYQYYTSDITPLSIDEFALHFENTPTLWGLTKKGLSVSDAMVQIAVQIKQRIRDEFEWMKVSVGIGPNRFLAKMASNIQKPDGLHEINKENILAILSKMQLEDIKGIKKGNGSRLRRYGITTPIQMFDASKTDLTKAFQSVNGLYWWQRLHGYEPDSREFDRKSFGNSHALYKPYLPHEKPLRQILLQLVLKMGYRLRHAGFSASGIHLSCLYADYSYWHQGKKLGGSVLSSNVLFEEACRLLDASFPKPIRTIAVSCHYLTQPQMVQQDLFSNNDRVQKLSDVIDRITERWGHNTVAPASLLGLERKVLDRVPFGAVKELEEFMFDDGISAQQYDL